jgi:hypothetical protein
MKKIIIAAALLTFSTSALASPGTAASLAASCCHALACCGIGLPCCG